MRLTASHWCALCAQQTTVEGKEEEETIPTQATCEEEVPERSENPVQPEKQEDLPSAEVKRSVNFFLL